LPGLERLAERRHGGLIVLQRNSNLDEYIRTGIPLDSEVTARSFC
jgi:DNA integrity scanning protein DisA with diadenylate cyclase activity